MPHDIEPRPVTVAVAEGVTLHGEVAVPAAPVAAAAVFHPHPRMGGDRHNPVVDALSRALAAADVAVLRVDFRGVGASSGSFGGGVDERLDAAATLAAAAALAPGTPLWAVGYSFGADVALSTDHRGLSGWIAVAPPLAVLADEPPAAADERPVTVLTPAHDQFCPPAVAGERLASWLATTVVEIPMADHFLAGSLGAVAAAAVEVIRPGGR